MDHVNVFTLHCTRIVSIGHVALAYVLHQHPIAIRIQCMCTTTQILYTQKFLLGKKNFCQFCHLLSLVNIFITLIFCHVFKDCIEYHIGENFLPNFLAIQR